MPPETWRLYKCLSVSFEPNRYLTMFFRWHFGPFQAKVIVLRPSRIDIWVLPYYMVHTREVKLVNPNEIYQA